MLEVESYRRNLQPTGYGHPSPPISVGDVPTGQAMPAYSSMSTILGQDRQKQIIHWQQGGSPLPASGPGSAASSGDISEDEEDDEYRPFTPPPPRERLSYTRYQLELLNGIYKQVRYPNSTQKQLIAKRVGITREQVKIWFQNRRRKDVVGNSKKNDSLSSEKSEQTSTDSDSSLSDDHRDASDKDLVPIVVMKSIVSEIQKFEKDHLRPKKGKKKAKTKVAKQKIEKANIPKGLIFSGYDMISPPNQITPSAFLGRNANKFHHSKSSSAFDAPKETAPKYPNLLTNFLETCGQSYSANLMQSPSRPIMCGPSSFGYPGGNVSCDLPVLSDLLSNKNGMDPKSRESLGQTPHHLYSSKRDSTDSMESLYPHSGFPSPFGMNRVYPFPFVAEPPMLLSSLRQQMEPYRPQPHYPSGSHTDDVNRYQPLTISSINNPYYSPTSSAWSAQSSNPGRFSQL